MSKLTNREVIEELNILYCNLEGFPRKRKALQESLETYKLTTAHSAPCKYCSEKTKTYWKYCPFCGNKIDRRT